MAVAERNRALNIADEAVQVGFALGDVAGRGADSSGITSVRVGRRHHARQPDPSLFFAEH